MWIVISYDFPSDKPVWYQHFRKGLLKSGFSFVQRSLCWRWVHSPERAESLCNSVRTALPPGGKILLWQLSDRAFASASWWEDGKSAAMPTPPEPWIII